ncbi:histidine kinase [Delftia tsuruhatensis]|uniref:histidine kinase n=1 Tax=Delftia tsuruhatensis TaxID=180282 RepID=UPI0028A6D3DB|nr:histidine kinase [Delftia tsuruhatensis]
MPIVCLPRNISLSALEGISRKFTRESQISRTRDIDLDFSNVAFCDPIGAVGLANFIGYFQSVNFNIGFKGHQNPTLGNKYLDDSGFFFEFLGESSFKNSGARLTTIPFRYFGKEDYMEYLYSRLTPWIAESVKLHPDTVETIRTCLEEIFHNVEYHSGVGKGFTLSQFYPQKKIIKIAISDYGIGIPNQVRTLRPELNDFRAILKACEEGFTTKTNVKNRGAGLALLIKYVVNRNGGSVELRSGLGHVLATNAHNGPYLTGTNQKWQYPGTIVQVSLRTDTLEQFDKDIEPEVFQW